MVPNNPLDQEYADLVRAVSTALRHAERAYKLPEFDPALGEFVRAELARGHGSLRWCDTFGEIAFVFGIAMQLVADYAELREQLVRDRVGDAPPWRRLGPRFLGVAAFSHAVAVRVSDGDRAYLLRAVDPDAKDWMRAPWRFTEIRRDGTSTVHPVIIDRSDVQAPTAELPGSGLGDGPDDAAMTQLRAGLTFLGVETDAARARFRVEATFDIAARGGLLVAGELLEGVVRRSSVLRDEETGAEVRVIGVELPGRAAAGRATTNRVTLLVDRRDADHVGAGRVLIEPAAQTLDSY